MPQADKVDTKLEMFIESKRNEDIIQHGVDKHFPRETLTIFSDPRGRLIVAEMIKQGRYAVEPPKIILIPKKHSTEKRKVYANSPLDRYVLALINSVYYDLYKGMIHKNCVSYQRGIGVRNIIQSIVSKLNQNATGYKADLSKYFDSVNQETIDGYLKKMDTGSALDTVLWDYYHDNRVIDEYGQQVERFKSLAQGCAVGTFLANVVLSDIDEELSRLDIVYYRYSDDLLILGKDADKAMEILKRRLPEKGLTLNPKKVEAIDSSKPFTFLGFDICGQNVSLSADSVDNFKTEIKKITKHGKDVKKFDRRTQAKAINKINNYLYNDYLRNEANFGWMEYFATISTDEKQMKTLDEFTKDHLKALYTGKWNHTTNRHKTSNEELEKLGYRSMVAMYKLRRMNRDVYVSALIQSQ